ncbi:hypothetical protein BpHYR1_032199 [Brachionus plicatilis]|uniref:Uncharacterized protein n=1 Tax=Brachionus plicatilis TaxID=10195 RepID=A0A3M7RJN6_BRAPC|nr:hypothetical protein BpHYR1_032199 [Brachionus plicatilis]
MLEKQNQLNVSLSIAKKTQTEVCEEFKIPRFYFLYCNFCTKISHCPKNAKRALIKQILKLSIISIELDIPYRFISHYFST